MKNRRVFPLLAIALFPGCSGGGLGVDSNDVVTQDAGADATAPSNTTSDDGEEAEGDDETWNGYVETYSFPSGSSSFVLTFTREPDGGISGHARFGSAPLLPPPTEPRVGYPEAEPPAGVEPASLEGFRYTLRSGSVEGNRVRASINGLELYAQWCALQTSEPQPTEATSQGEPPYGCTPPAVYSMAALPYCPPYELPYEGYEGGLPTYNCAWLELCGTGTCSCSASGCTSATSGAATSFDFQLDGARGAGSVELQGDGPYNIDLSQQ